MHQGFAIGYFCKKKSHDYGWGSHPLNHFILEAYVEMHLILSKGNTNNSIFEVFITVFIGTNN